jgi:hypothetical protein
MSEDKTYKLTENGKQGVLVRSIMDVLDKIACLATFEPNTVEAYLYSLEPQKLNRLRTFLNQLLTAIEEF